MPLISPKDEAIKKIRIIVRMSILSMVIKEDRLQKPKAQGGDMQPEDLQCLSVFDVRKLLWIRIFFFPKK